MIEANTEIRLHGTMEEVALNEILDDNLEIDPQAVACLFAELTKSVIRLTIITHELQAKMEESA